MYTEKQFIEFIEYTTGKKSGKDFGFIDRVHSPHSKEGFMVWRKEGDLTSEYWIKPETQEEYLKTIIEFLLRDIKKEYEEAMSKIELHGENEDCSLNK